MRYGRWGKGYRTQGRRGTAKDALSVFFLSFYLNGFQTIALAIPALPPPCNLHTAKSAPPPRSSKDHGDQKWVGLPPHFPPPTILPFLLFLFLLLR